MCTERNKELSYLQEQLELLINEKITLQTRLDSQQGRESNWKDLYHAEQQKAIQIIQENEQLKSDLPRYLNQQETIDQQNARIAELEGEIGHLKILQNPSSVPLAPPALRLKDLQCRIEVIKR